MKQHLNRPVHQALAWLAIAAAYVPSFLIINVALAQDAGVGIFAPNSTSTKVSDVSFALPPVGYASSTDSFVPPFPLEPGKLPIDSAQARPSFDPSVASGTQPILPPADSILPYSPDQKGMMPPADFANPIGSCPEGVVCSGQRLRNEAEQKRMEEERMRGMKNNLGGFVRGMKMAQTQVERLKKQGVTPPEELVEAMKNVDAVTVKVKNIKSVEEMEALQEEIQDTVSAVEEWMPKLPMLFELPRVVKQAEKEMTKLNKTYKADEKRAKANKKIDLKEELAEFKAAIDKHQALLNEIKALSKKDPEEAVSKMHEEFYPGLDDVWQHEEVLQIALNFQKGITRMNNEIKNGEHLIKKLKAQKLDTAELEMTLKEVKEKFADIKNLYKIKPLNSVALIDAIDEMMSITQEFANQAEDLTGEAEFEPTLMNKEVEIKLPEAYRGFGNGLKPAERPSTR